MFGLLLRDPTMIMAQENTMLKAKEEFNRIDVNVVRITKFNYFIGASCFNSPNQLSMTLGHFRKKQDIHDPQKGQPLRISTNVINGHLRTTRRRTEDNSNYSSTTTRPYAPSFGMIASVYPDRERLFRRSDSSPGAYHLIRFPVVPCRRMRIGPTGTTRSSGVLPVPFTRCTVIPDLIL